MAEKTEVKSSRKIQFRHRGRGEQVWIYLGKLLRMFVYQSDWKVLPMSALVAGLVGMVVRRRMFLNMEGTLMGAFAYACVCLWNGSFNSIQVICRERDVIKREHRSGMHVSSYVFSHMIYQALLCILQTGITLYVTSLTGVQYPSESLFTPWYMVDLGISMFLITFASDMLSLWVSALAKTTTTAMTIMPFVLIFQLVFSGGMLQLSAWTKPLTELTISNPGLKVIAAQADTNNRPFVTISDMLHKMRGNEIKGTVKYGQIADLLENEEIPVIAEMRSYPLGEELKAGDIIDLAAEAEELQPYLEEGFDYDFTVGEVIDLVGEEKVKTFIEEKAAEASYVAEYEYTAGNVIGYWVRLGMFALLFAVLATITLEFIDKDKR